MMSLWSIFGVFADHGNQLALQLWQNPVRRMCVRTAFMHQDELQALLGQSGCFSFFTQKNEKRPMLITLQTDVSWPRLGPR